MNLEPYLPSLITGGAVLSGVLISQFTSIFAAWRERKHDRSVRQIERLEKLAESAGESLGYIQEVGSYLTFAAMRSVAPSLSARKAASLADLYFPDLVEPTAALSNALVDYCHFAQSAFQEGPATAGEQMIAYYMRHPETEKYVDNPIKARHTLDGAIAKEAKKYRHV